MSNPGLIGRIAVDKGMITRDQLRHATRQQGRHPDKRLGELLVDLGYIDEGQLGALLAAQARAGESARPPRRHTPVPAKKPVPDGVKLGAIALKRVAASQFSESSKDSDDIPRREGAEARGWLLGLLADGNAAGASEVLMLPEQPVRLRRFGRLHDFTTGPVSANGTKRLLMEALTQEDIVVLEAQGHVCVMFEAPAVGRYRLQVQRELGGYGGTFHRAQLGETQPTLNDLGLPSWIVGLTNLPHGLVLIAGPACSGRSTTMGALVHWICEERSDHIAVIETPRELKPTTGECVVTQLEVGKHCSSARAALDDAPRMDVNVVCVDELAADAMDAALRAADTDHLVIATMRAPSSSRALEALIDSYPVDERRAACELVSDVVKAVITQRLVPALNREATEEIGMLLALEVIVVDDGLRDIIRSGDLGQIATYVQTGKSPESQLLDSALMDLVRARRITMDSARAHARNPAAFARESNS